jgi:hypothetical protein
MVAPVTYHLEGHLSYWPDGYVHVTFTEGLDPLRYDHKQLVRGFQSGLQFIVFGCRHVFLPLL